MVIYIAMENSLEIPDGLNDIYDKFINQKFAIKFNDKQKMPRGNPCAEDVIETQEEELRKIHCELAVKLLVKDYDEKLWPALGEFERYKERYKRSEKLNVNERIAKYGICILKGNQPEFIHRSFAEYFLNEYLTKNLSLSTQNHCVRTHLLKTILFCPDFKVNRLFLNGYLKKNSEQTEIIDQIKKFLSDNFRKHSTILHRIAMQDICEVFKILLEILRLKQKNDENRLIRQRELVLLPYNNGNTLYHSLSNRSPETMNCLLDWVKENLGDDTVIKLIRNGRFNDSGEIIESSLFAAVRSQNGDSEMIKALLNWIEKIPQEKLD